MLLPIRVDRPDQRVQFHHPIKMQQQVTALREYIRQESKGKPVLVWPVFSQKLGNQTILNPAHTVESKAERVCRRALPIVMCKLVQGGSRLQAGSEIDSLQIHLPLLDLLGEGADLKTLENPTTVCCCFVK
jgi:hypothetical protein